jgi:hypothetical protein
MLTSDTLRPLLVSALRWSTADVESYLAALRARCMLQAGDAPIRTETAVFVLLTFLTGFPPREAIDEALRLGSHCSAGTSTQRVGIGEASVSCTPAPGGAPLLPVLVGIITEMRAGTFLPPEGGRLFQLRRVLGPKADFVLIEGFSRAGASAVISGVYFAPVTSTRPATLDGALTLQIETAVSWLLLEEIAAQLGPVPSDAAADSAITATEASQPAAVIH